MSDNAKFSPVYGRVEADSFDGLSANQAKILLWASFGGHEDKFDKFAEEFLSEEPDEYPEEVIHENGEEFADAILGKHPEIDAWFDEAKVGGMKLRDFLDRMEKFLNGGLHGGENDGPDFHSRMVRGLSLEIVDVVARSAESAVARAQAAMARAERLREKIVPVDGHENENGVASFQSNQDGFFRL